MVTKVSTPLSAWSESTSVIDARPFIAAASLVAHSFRSAWLSLLSVYWKLALAERPPARKSCTGLRNSCTPVTRASLGRSRAITAWPATLRWLAGFRLMNMKPPPARRPPVKPTTVSTSGSFLMMLTSAQLALHGLEGDALVGADAAGDLAGVLLREAALGYLGEQVDVQADHEDEAEHHQRDARQSPVQAMLVDAQHGAEASFEGARDAARRLGVVLRLEQPGAQHRRGGQRNHQRDHDGGRQRDGELAEQRAELAAHEQQRDEHGDQRKTDRQHREADFARAQQGRLETVHAGLDVAGGIFQHHDGVVDDEAGGHGQRHQRQIIQAEAEQVHHAEGAEQ